MMGVGVVWAGAAADGPMLTYRGRAWVWRVGGWDVLDPAVSLDYLAQPTNPQAAACQWMLLIADVVILRPRGRCGKQSQPFSAIFRFQTKANTSLQCQNPKYRIHYTSFIIISILDFDIEVKFIERYTIST